MSEMNRRRFTAEMAAALLGGAAITIGCGGGGSPNSPVPLPTQAPPGPAPNVGVIAENHGHVAIITGAQLLAGGALTLDIQGSAHPHTLTLSSDDVTRIRGGERITKTSSNNVGLFGPHEHVIVFN
jgi:hypothetical protein